MSRMSELHEDLSTIHSILLGQRKVASDALVNVGGPNELDRLESRIECIDDLLLEFEAAGVLWPDNVVSLHG